MKRFNLAILVALVALPLAWAEPAYLLKSDKLSNLDKHQQSIDLLESKLPGVQEAKARAAIYWRLARDTFDIANLKGVAAGNDRPYLKLYEQSEHYADRAIALAPENAHGYYWKAACVGKISQIKNLVRAFIEAGKVRDLLDKAGRLDPSDGEIWYVLAQLYSQIPGWPLSFGNTSYAVSLGRKGLAARKAQVAAGTEPDVPEDYYIQLAKELARRNWSAAERQRQHPQEAREYSNASGPVKKNLYYEGAVSIPDISDRAEAIQIDQGVKHRLESLATRTTTQENDLRTVRHDLEDWTH